MRPPLRGRDVVDIAVEVFGELAGVLHGDVERDSLLLADDRDHVGVDRVAGAIEPLDEFNDPPLVEILLRLAAGGVGEDDLHARVEEGEFLEAAGEDIEGELRRRENLRIGLEGRLRAGAGGGADVADQARGDAALVLLLPEVAATRDLHLAPFGEEVHHRDADAMEAARGLVGALLELASEFQDRHHPLEGRHFTVHLLGELRMLLHGDAAAVVLDGDTPVDVHHHAHALGVVGHALVDRVVDDLVDEVVEAAGGVVTDVHAEPFANMIAVGKMEQILGCVSGCAGLVSHGKAPPGMTGLGLSAGRLRPASIQGWTVVQRDRSVRKGGGSECR